MIAGCWRGKNDGTVFDRGCWTCLPKLPLEDVHVGVEGGLEDEDGEEDEENHVRGHGDPVIGWEAEGGGGGGQGTAAARHGIARDVTGWYVMG